MTTQEYNTNIEITPINKLENLKNMASATQEAPKTSLLESIPTISEFRTSLEDLLKKANEVKELNPEALKAATSEQKPSVEAMKIEYFRLSINQLRAKLAEVTESSINNKDIRIEALKELIAENEEAIEATRPTKGFFKNLLSFRKGSNE